MKRARLIYNPTSGQEIVTKHIAELLVELESLGYETSTFQTTAEENSAKIEAERVTKRGFDLIVAAGGDGTINEIVSGMAPSMIRPKLAIIPTGTTNDFARALKIPRNNPLAALKVLEKNQTLMIDVGKVTQNDEENYFINIAAGGGLTELTYSVPSQMKTVFGYLSYIAKGAELLPKVRKGKVRVTHDEGVFEGDISMFFCALTNSVGGFEKIAPDAKLDDGLFTLLLIKTDNLLDLMALLAIVAGGNHLNDVNVEYIKTSKLEIEPLENQEILINIDGEYGGKAPVKFENLQNHLEIFVNLDEIQNEHYIGDPDELALEAVAHKFADEVKKIEK